MELWIEQNCTNNFCIIINQIKAKEDKMTNVGGIAKDQLKSYIDRIENLENEAKAIRNDIREIYMEAKASGFKSKIMKKCIKLKSVPMEKREEEDRLMELYMTALDFDYTPLGDAAKRAEAA